MNVNDVETERPEGDKLELIFKRQAELKEKYHHIEESQGVGYGILQGNKFDINEIRSQCLIKDLIWRVVEEITEAHACQEHERFHFLEELADAMHFITELCIQVGIGPASIALDVIVDKDADYLDNLMRQTDSEKPLNPWWTVFHLGFAANCLKQKPWKQTHILTDVEKFEMHVIDAYRAFCLHLRCFATSDQMFDFYFKKSKVNDFRIKTKY